MNEYSLVIRNEKGFPQFVSMVMPYNACADMKTIMGEGDIVDADTGRELKRTMANGQRI